MDVGLTYKRIDYQSVDGLESKEDALAVEQPLEIRLSFPGERPVQRVAVTMRTPGEDIQLALGFLYNEGIIDDFSSVNAILQEEENIVRIQLEKELPKSQKVERNF